MEKIYRNASDLGFKPSHLPEQFDFEGQTAIRQGFYIDSDKMGWTEYKLDDGRDLKVIND